MAEPAKVAPPSTPVDEVIGNSESLAQSTEEAAQSGEVQEATEAKQQENSEQQGDVDMKEAGEESKQEEAVTADKQDGDDVEMTGVKAAPSAGEEKAQSSDVEIKTEDNEAKTEDDEPVASGEAEAQKSAAASDKNVESGDVEMNENGMEEFKSESNGATDDHANQTAEKEASASAEAVIVTADAAATVASSPKEAQNAPVTDKATSATPAKQLSSPSKASASGDVIATGNDSNGTDARQSEGEENASEQASASPKRKEAGEMSNGNSADPADTEPAAKKQKVDENGAKVADSAVADGSAPSVMISRDDMAKMEEDSGRLKFDVITNDGTDEHMIQLTTLKNIFAKQLPKMPKEYIVRLVFDKNHRSMLILKNGTHVIGGICYRPFEKNHFAEIAFCAINASDQVKGYGTRLMNHLKEYVKTKNITHFLTYADNYAIGYFKKQGFTKSVSMARPNWYGYIKDYDGGTLMECTIHTQINYLRITSMIHKQREAIQNKIQERSRSQTVYPGLTQFAEGRLMDIYMVPGVKEAGWSQATIRNNRIGCVVCQSYAFTTLLTGSAYLRRTRDQGSLKSQLSQLLKAVSSHRSAWPFHEPVDTSVVVDYLDHIKEPIDLQLISKRIDSGVYISKAAFKADLDKMCDNCTTYNTPDTNYYKAAMDLREFIQTRIQIRDHK
ncbi:unnamed protein product [Phytophthora fragariaefolia]|uniref:histone acetyltransferase n=1 Tax=Phytophthora fragariaefolia TaxID=1490495 RepID=A0A9W6WS82_9STRA|nr:unnamed protein product [Phytophthora fragariaefolia]